MRMRSFLLMGVLFFIHGAGALPPEVMPPPPEVITSFYQCRVGVIHKALAEGSKDFTFQVPLGGTGAHGGQELEFKVDNQVVTVVADGKWLAIHWQIADKIIAEVVTVIATATKEPRVLIAYDPADPQSNQVALDCTYEEKK